MNNELDKLEAWLKKNKKIYKRINEGWWDQIIVYDDGMIIWDATWRIGSHGFEQGLLEISGDIVNEEKDKGRVVECLTADDIIERVKKVYGENNRRDN